MSPSPYQPGPAWRIAALLFLFMLVNFMDKIVVGLLAVPMMAELGLSPAQFGLLSSSFFWLFALAGVAGGLLADRRPATGLLLAMALLWSLCQLPMALSGSLAGLMLARMLLGAGEGPAAPVVTHALYKWFPDHKRHLPVAVMTLGAAAGLLLSGLLVPAVTARWGWRSNFILLALLGLAWALAWWRFGREGPLDDAGPAAGETRPLPWRRLLGRRPVLASLLMRFAAYWGLALILTWVPAYLQLGLGYGPAQAGRLFALVVVLMMPFGLLFAGLSERLLARGVAPLIARGLLAAGALAVAGLLFLGLQQPGLSPAQRIALLTLAGGLAQPIYTLGPAMIAAAVPARQRGAVLAVDSSAGSLAGVIAPYATGLLIQQQLGTAGGYERGFALCGGLMLLGAAAGALLLGLRSGEAPADATLADGP
ncbi:MFS transporter [Pelomonas sp. KK5]|uniref:MFS transporter n=1 Tax=Pelomonas sp. KK5 TaxID=1855730 RepID=UPI00097C466D|nr:MFS transporter [Pelomonas sp. KK5]